MPKIKTYQYRIRTYGLYVLESMSRNVALISWINVHRTPIYIICQQQITVLRAWITALPAINIILSCIYNTRYIILFFFIIIIILLFIIILLGLLLILLGQHILSVYKLNLERIKFIAKLSIRKLKFLSG